MSFFPDYLGGGFSATFVNLTLTGNLSFGAAAVQSLSLGDDDELRFGASNDAAIMWNTAQTVDGWYFGTADGQNTMIIAEYGDRTFDFAHGAQTNPTLFGHSAAQSTTQWWSITHNQTDSIITSGAGDLRLTPASSSRVDINGLGEQNVTLSDGTIGLDLNFSTSGAGSANRIGMDIVLSAGSTTSGFTTAMSFENVVAGTNSAYSTDATYGSRPSGNRGAGGYARATTTGHNVGLLGGAVGGNVNYGAWLVASAAVANKSNVGVIGIGFNDASGGEGIGVYALYNNPSAQPTIAADIKTAFLADNASNAVDIAVFNDNAVEVYAIQDFGSISHTPTASTSGNQSYLIFTSPSDTGLTASTEVIGHSWSGANKTWLAGNITNQREFAIGQPTYTIAGGASSITNAATLSFNGAPIGGTSTTIINSSCISIGTFTYANTTNGLAFSTVSPGIANGTGNMTTLSSIGIVAAGNVSLGNQTATLTTLTLFSVDTITYDSTTNTRTVTTANAGVFRAPSSGSNVTMNAVNVLNLGAASTHVSAAAFAYTVISMPSHTLTLTGSTNPTGVPTVAGINLGQITISNATIATTNAASIYVLGAPLAAGGGSITNAYSLWIDSGVSAFGGNVVPDASDGAALGTTSLMWSDLFLASGGVINFNAGNSTITHTAANNITVANTSSSWRFLGGASNTTFTISRSSGKAIAYYADGSGQAMIFDNTVGYDFTSDTNANITGGTFGTGTAIVTIKGPQTNLTAGTEFSNFSALATTKNWATGALTTQREFRFIAPTYTVNAASTFTTASTVDISAAPTASTNVTITNASALSVGGATTQVSAAGLAYSGIIIPAHTVTVTGSTNPTGSPAFAGMYIGQITVSNAAIATTNAASLYISAAPVAAGGGSITNAYAAWIDAGAVRFDGDFIIGSKSIDTTAGDSATINAIAGRFRKDNTGSTFTLTNSFITANSIIVLQAANAAIDATATGWTVSAGAGSATITFNAAPTSNFDMNFLVIN